MSARRLGAVFSTLVLAACSSAHHTGAKQTVRAGATVRALGGPKGAWTGRVAGTDAFVAVVADGEQLIAYVCDKGKTTEWFSGSDTGSAVAFAARDGSALALSLGVKAAGTVRLRDRKQHAFALAPTTRASLYRADAGNKKTRALAGWIKLDDGEVRGAVQLTSGPTATPTVSIGPAPSLSSPTLSTPTITVSFFPTPMTPDTLGAPVPNQQLTFRWVAMGDSYGAGEGNPQHGINDPGNIDKFDGVSWGSDRSMFVPDESATDYQSDLFTCHRSDEGGSPKANRTLKTLYPDFTISFDFVACSGATTDDLRFDGYRGPVNVVSASHLGHSFQAQPAQLDRARRYAETLPDRHLDALFFSAGGNDIGFAQIVGDCLDPTKPDCDKSWGTELPKRLATLATSYDSVAHDIANEFPTQPPRIFVNEYPNPIDDGVVNGGGVTVPACYGEADFAHADVGHPGAYDDFIKNNVTPNEINFAYSVAPRMDGVIDQAVLDHNWDPVRGHLSKFAGHGFCTSQPFANLNSSALHRQGHDSLQGHGLFVLSEGLLHPNDAGYRAMGDALASSLEPMLDDKIDLGLQPPANVRIAAAAENGAITLRWDDRSTTEDSYAVTVRPTDAESRANTRPPAGALALPTGGYVARIDGANAQQFVDHPAGPGLWTYSVQACNSDVRHGSAPQFTPEDCGPPGAVVDGANFRPAVPTGLSFVSTSIPETVGGRVGSLAATALTWSSQLAAIEYVVHIAPKPGSPGTATDVRTTSTTSPAVATAVAKSEDWSVAACNRVGCSPFGAPTSP